MSGIECLNQHIKVLAEDPHSYRPSRCPGCGKAGLWCHGRYPRWPGCNLDDRHLNPVFILRFICPDCGKTCSVLPEYIPPRRWYLWAVQQLVLSALLAGQSIRSVSHKAGRARSTVRRWRDWLEARYAEFGRAQTVASFWPSVWRVMNLAKTMTYCHQYGMTVP